MFTKEAPVESAIDPRELQAAQSGKNKRGGGDFEPDEIFHDFGFYGDYASEEDDDDDDDDDDGDNDDDAGRGDGDETNGNRNNSSHSNAAPETKE